MLCNLRISKKIKIMKTTNTNAGKHILITFLIIMFALFCLNYCKKDIYNNLDGQDILLKQSIDSSRIEFEKLKLVSEKLEFDLDLVNKELLESHNQTQIAETILYKLRQNNKRPEYVPEIANCNDTIQSVYNISIQKDSACNDVIASKNIELDKKNTIINIQKNEKNIFTESVKNKEFENGKLNDIIAVKEIEIVQEKKKRTFWEYVSYVGWCVVGYLAIKK